MQLRASSELRVLFAEYLPILLGSALYGLSTVLFVFPNALLLVGSFFTTVFMRQHP